MLLIIIITCNSVLSICLCILLTFINLLIVTWLGYTSRILILCYGHLCILAFHFCFSTLSVLCLDGIVLFFVEIVIFSYIENVDSLTLVFNVYLLCLFVLLKYYTVNLIKIYFTVIQVRCLAIYKTWCDQPFSFYSSLYIINLY